MNNEIAIFILTHGRADKQDTFNTLKRMNCQIPIYFLVDDMDDEFEAYKQKYDNVVVFQKSQVNCDIMTNQEIWASPVFARNYANEFANQNGIKYFVMMDDDITDFKIRALKNEKLKAFKINNINSVFYAMQEYMEKTKQIALLGFAQSGAYIGGANGSYKDKVRRDISQVFMCRAEDYTKFRGIVCQDFLASLDCSLKGQIALASFLVSITSPQRMSNKGGLYDTYQNTGVYSRDFYKCMAYPSIGKFNSKFEYQKQTNFTFPKVLNEKCKKR